jgi:hypothetical protein
MNFPNEVSGKLLNTVLEQIPAPNPLEKILRDFYALSYKLKNHQATDCEGEKIRCPV